MQAAGLELNREFGTYDFAEFSQYGIADLPALADAAGVRDRCQQNQTVSLLMATERWPLPLYSVHAGNAAIRSQQISGVFT